MAECLSSVLRVLCLIPRTIETEIGTLTPVIWELGRQRQESEFEVSFTSCSLISQTFFSKTILSNSDGLRGTLFYFFPLHISLLDKWEQLDLFSLHGHGKIPHFWGALGNPWNALLCLCIMGNPPYFTHSPYGSCDIPSGRESSSLTPSLGRGAKQGLDGKLNTTQSAYQPVQVLG